MARTSAFDLFVLSFTSLLLSATSLAPARLCVIQNRVGSQRGMLAFRSITDTKQTAAVAVSYGDSVSYSASWGPWKALGAPLAKLPLSNPVCDYTDRNQTQIFVQAADGQVYAATQDERSYLTFSSWKRVGQNLLPSQTGQDALVDSVFVGQYGKDILVFARTLSRNSSQLYWCKGNTTGFGSWSLLGGSKAVLATDAELIMNPYSGKYEAFMISANGLIHRTWQHNEHSFADWRTMDFAPSFSTDSKPAAQVMGYEFMNGKLMVGGMGRDGQVHQVSQTTCDTIDNPWSYCTWGSWYKAGGTIPFTRGGVRNNFVMSRNVHFGVEMFSIGESSGQLWQVWQLQRDGTWHGWSSVSQDLKRAAFTSLPYLRVNSGGWWMAYGLNASNQVVVLEPSRSMNATPEHIPWGTNLTVSWDVSVDEATRLDWVAIYPLGANNDQYVDYRYVQGSLNPGKNPVPAGNITMESYLPSGTYQVRYLVNRKYVNIIDKGVAYYNQSQESEIFQLYEGIFTGLGIFNKGIQECVDEGATTIEKFEEAFHAFETEEIIKGLELFGTALEDVAQTLRMCEEVELAKDLEKFIKDLVECTEDDCNAFVIDLLQEVLIVYQNEYEIYGDIKGASNSFDLLQAYQQGGLCIGRLVNACLGVSPPPENTDRAVNDVRGRGVVKMTKLNDAVNRMAKTDNSGVKTEEKNTILK